jgi:hypothetical protein
MVASGRTPTSCPFTFAPTVRIALVERSTKYPPSDCQKALCFGRSTCTRVATS